MDLGSIAARVQWGLQTGLIHMQRIDVAEVSVASSPPKPHGTGPSGTDQATFPADRPLEAFDRQEMKI